jgi:hypothetical protein
VTFRPGAKVYDAWWSWRAGVVRRVTKTRVHVEWFDGEVWEYDREHVQFLRNQAKGGA